MTRVANAARARTAATELLEKHGAASIPVNVERVAKAEGVRVEYAPLDGELSGLAHVRDGVPIIGVNMLHAPNRQRFTLAHELGHIFLHRPQLELAVHVDRGSLRRDPVSAAGTDPQEIEANAFASELLMPEHLIKAALEGKAIDLEDDDAIAALAKRFRVSDAAMRLRLDTL
jgi:Zn-dependent peptidase ImmA (M78 family)